MAKFCSQCGTQLDDAVMFCSQCGAKQEVSAPVQETVEPVYTAPVQEAVQPVYTAPVQTPQVTPAYTPAPTAKKGISKFIWLIAIVLQIAAVLVFSLTEAVDSTISLTGSVSQSGYSQDIDQTSSESGKIFEICDPGNSDEAEQFEAYGFDLDGFKTLKIVMIAIIAVAGLGVLVMAIAIATKPGKNAICGAVGIFSQIAFLGGTMLWVFVLLKNELESFMTSSMKIMYESYEAYGVTVDLSVKVADNFTTLGWLAMGLVGAAIVTTVAAMVKSKSEAATAPSVPVMY